MKIKSVTIKGFHNVSEKTYEFSDMTYLIGANGAGKSTIMQAIQLALLGYIPGTAKTKPEIFQHANSNSMSVELILTDTDSEICINRMWIKSGATITNFIETIPENYDIEKIISELEFPIFNFNEFINMTANKLKDWFISFLPSMEVKTDWSFVLKQKLLEKELPDIDENLIADSVAEIAEFNLSGIDEIRKANEHFKTILSVKKKELERVQGTIQSLIFYDDMEVSDIEEVQKELDTQRNILQKIYDRDSILSRNASIKSKLANIPGVTSDSYETDPEYIKMTTAIESLSEQQQDCEKQFVKEDEEKREYIRKITDITNATHLLQVKAESRSEVIASGETCPITKQKCESIQVLLDDYRREIQSYEDEIQLYKDDIEELRKSLDEHTERCEKLLEDREEIRKKITQLQMDAETIKHNYTTVSMLKSQLAEVPDVSVDYDISERIRSLENTIVKIKANQKYNETIDILTVEKYKIENHIASYKYWIDLTGVNGLQNATGESNPFIGLEDSMNTYLHTVFGESVSAKFNLVAKANSFSFGITRKSAYIPFNLLSSGEKCLYTLALMLSIIHVAKSPLKVIMVDDLFDHLDNINADKLFTSLQQVKDIQMVFAGVKEVNCNYKVEVK